MQTTSPQLPNKNYEFWLKEVNYLTTSLRECCGDIRLIKHSQQLHQLQRFEQNLLAVDTSFVRQISLLNKDKELVFARTVITPETYEYFRETLENLGDNPIGDNFLYINSNFLRGDFIVRKMSPVEFKNETGYNSQGCDVYSRSSVFSYKNTAMKILITEYFLDMDFLIRERANAN